MYSQPVVTCPSYETNICLPCNCIVFWTVWCTKKLIMEAWRFTLKKIVAAIVIKSNLETGQFGKKNKALSSTIFMYTSFSENNVLKRWHSRTKICWSFIIRSLIPSGNSRVFSLPTKNMFPAKSLGSFYELSRIGKQVCL